MQTPLKTIGKIGTAYGLKGAVFIKPSDTEPSWVGKLTQVFLLENAQTMPITVVNSRHHNDKIVMQFQGISDRTAAEQLRGLFVQAAEDQLPALETDEYYVDSLVGLAVKSVDSGVVLGSVGDVLSSSAGQFLEVLVAAGKEPVLVPFQTVFVPQVDLENQVLFLKGLDNLFEEEA